MRAVAVVGYSGSGKTLVVESLVRGLVERGLEVATIKHVRGERIDLADKDTWRHLEAGSSLALALADSETVEIVPERIELREALYRLSSFDFVVVEGFKEEFPGPKIVAAKDLDEVSELIDELTIAISGLIGRRGIEKAIGVPVVEPGDRRALVSLVLDRVPDLPALLNCGKCGYRSCREFVAAVLRGERSADECVYRALERVELEVDRKRIPLNEFVSSLFERVIGALVGSLRGVGEPGEIKVVVRKRRRFESE